LAEGGRWGAEYEQRLNASTPFLYQDTLLSTRAHGQTSFNVLDVGAGPLTCCGYRVTLEPNMQLNVSAVDPLAEDYDRALQKAGVVPVVRVRRAPAEELASHFAADHFDFVFSRNALDHSRDPVRALRQMLTIVKPGRLVLIELMENEADHMGYDGFHRAATPHFGPSLMQLALLPAYFGHPDSHEPWLRPSHLGPRPDARAEWNFALTKTTSSPQVPYRLAIRRYAWDEVDVADALCDHVSSVSCWRGGRSYERRSEQRRVLSCELRRGYSCVRHV
jgi:SAM-dependent methyltransferase